MGATSGRPSVNAVLGAMAIVAVLAGSLAAGPVAGSSAIPRRPVSASAASPTLTPMSGRGTATTDGWAGDGEWDGAAYTNRTVLLPDADGGGMANVTIAVMNDETNLYLATWLDAVPGCAFYPTFWFDSDGDGDVSDLSSDYLGAHAMSWSEGAVELLDGFVFPEHNAGLDTAELAGYPPAGSIDGTAGAGHPSGTTTFIEIAHPIDSPDDAHDFSRSIGGSIRMVVELSVQGGTCGTCDTAGCFTATTAPELGQYEVAFVPDDDVAPAMVGVPAVGGAVPSVLGEGSTLISWAAEDPGGTGVAMYHVERRRNGGPWRTVDVTTGTELRTALRVGDRYRFRVAARDRAGNWGSPAAGPAFTPTLVQETGSGVRFEGRWSRVRAGSASGGTVRFTTRRGDSARFRVTGYAVSVVTATGPTRGRVAIYVDGVRRGVVDLHAGAVHWRRIRFSMTWMEGGKHTIELRNLDRGMRLDLDAFVVYR